MSRNKLKAVVFVAACALALAGCSNKKEDTESFKGSHNSTIVRKRSKTNKDNSSKNTQNTANTTDSDTKDNDSDDNRTEDKTPSAKDLMVNVKDFNEADFVLNFKDTDETGGFKGKIQEQPRVVYFEVTDGGNGKTWATDSAVYMNDSGEWDKMKQPGYTGAYDPITDFPAVSDMKVAKDGDGYTASYQGNSADVVDVLKKAIAQYQHISQDPFGDDDADVIKFTYSFNAQKQLTGIKYEWQAGSHQGSAVYININAQKLTVPTSVINSAK